MENSPKRARDEPDKPEDDADAIGGPGCGEDARCVPKKSINALKRERERSKQGSEEKLTWKALDEMEESGYKRNVPGDVQNDLECSRNEENNGNECVALRWGVGRPCRVRRD